MFASLPSGQIVRTWLRRYLGTDESLVLLLLLVSAGLAIYFVGDILAPILAALVIAFMLEGLLVRLRGLGLRLWAALTITYTVFVLLMMLVLLMGIPLLRQLNELLAVLPHMFNTFGEELITYTANLTVGVPGMSGDELRLQFAERVKELSEWLAKQVLEGIPQAIIWLAYLLVVPFFVLFFLRDSDKYPVWLNARFPVMYSSVRKIWRPLRPLLEGYIRGKTIEILLVAVASSIAFASLGLRYAAVIGIVCGLSALLPYVGVFVATALVLMLGLFQFGSGESFLLLLSFHGIIQVIDGYVLAPWLYSRTVRLHPATVLASVILFGGLWGVWGAFFAIPIALLVRELYHHWPKRKVAPGESSPAD